MGNAARDFFIVFLVCALAMQTLIGVWEGRQDEIQSLASASLRHDVEVLSAEVRAMQHLLDSVPSDVLWLTSSVAGMEYRMKLVVNASRTGWWSDETMALMGREYLYRREVVR